VPFSPHSPDSVTLPLNPLVSKFFFPSTFGRRRVLTATPLLPDFFEQFALGGTNFLPRTSRPPCPRPTAAFPRFTKSFIPLAEERAFRADGPNRGALGRDHLGHTADPGGFFRVAGAGTLLAWPPLSPRSPPRQRYRTIVLSLSDTLRPSLFLPGACEPAEPALIDMTSTPRLPSRRLPGAHLTEAQKFLRSLTFRGSPPDLSMCVWTPWPVPGERSHILPFPSFRLVSPSTRTRAHTRAGRNPPPPNDHVFLRTGTR